MTESVAMSVGVAAIEFRGARYRGYAAVAAPNQVVPADRIARNVGPALAILVRCLGDGSDLSCGGDRHDVAAGDRHASPGCRRSRRSAVQLLDPRVDRWPGPQRPAWRLRGVVSLLGRQHLLSGEADARVFRTPDASDVAGSARAGRHAQHHPLLQLAAAVDVRAVGARDVPPRARTDG